LTIQILSDVQKLEALLKQTLISTLLATTVLTTPLIASDLSGSRPGTYLPQVAGTFTPNAEFRPVLDGLRLWVSNHCNDNAEVMEVHDRLITAMGRAGAFKDQSHLQTIDALFIAAEAHQYQSRKSPPFTPYIVHPIGVALILWEEGGVRNPDILAAALLHDTVEDTDLTLKQIQERFGHAVATYVNEVTDDKSLPKAERKQMQIVNAAQISEGGKQIKLADKLYNLRNLTARTPVEIDDSGMTPWSEERVDAYFVWANQVTAGLRGANPALEQQLDAVLGNA
jgi:guanosine-3',5'-bis(diphosphate) 3'-pyrophosphohydrolase